MEPSKIPRKKTEPRKKRETFTIGFRVDGYALSLLEKGAAAYGISVHEYARQRLMELLERQEEARLLSEIDEVKSDVGELREDLARALEVILVNTTKSDSSAIRNWIETNLRRG